MTGGTQPLNLSTSQPLFPPLPHPLRETWPEKASILKQRKGSTSRRPVARKGEQGIMGRAICGCVRWCVGFGQVPQIQMWFGDGCASHRRRSPSCSQTVMPPSLSRRGERASLGGGERQAGAQSPIHIVPRGCAPAADTLHTLCPWRFASQPLFQPVREAFRLSLVGRTSCDGEWLSGAPSSHPPMNIPCPSSGSRLRPL
jgi:hypothetical protein